MPLPDLLRLINEQDATVPGAVAAVLPQIELAVQAGVRALRSGGRIHYFGAGTSGRAAFADAAELRPTFSLDPDKVVAHVAGGLEALWSAVESAEDDDAAGERDAASVTSQDLVIGVAASGATPYVAGALRQARKVGATTALISSHPHAPLAEYADIDIAVNTGPEVITGSTRMKAGTAAKLVLHTFSTAVMVRIGRTWSNLMVCAVPTNAKLRQRAVRTLVSATGVDPDVAQAAIDAAGQELPVALVMLLSTVDAATAREALAAAHGVVADAVRALT
ncbi:N-acetylmuramic acid 6-phosphate etherase [Allorhizocola rhizosphaerae]|uniref:N-acetylmuramic acid 6-phosphate etherase n=1 Tax=Allorhizocola rhizosphaerae TaxID=1872709 RepID=UPI001FE8ADC9|nr:N-acetylmuramic acid 6-phosphate etherase [Allorhizocola rhizosphaerae]